MNYIWLLNGCSAPSHFEIARFRSKRLAECADELLSQLVHHLRGIGEITFEHPFVDGTKIEANANKYSFVWKKDRTNTRRGWTRSWKSCCRNCAAGTVLLRLIRIRYCMSWNKRQIFRLCMDEGTEKVICSGILNSFENFYGESRSTRATMRPLGGATVFPRQIRMQPSCI